MKDPLLSAFDRLVLRDPEAPVVLSPGRRDTVGELNALTRTVATRATDRGLGPGNLVGLISPNGPGFLALLLGLRRAGCAVALLNSRTTDHELSRARSRFGLSAVARCRMSWPEDARDLVVDEPWAAGADVTPRQPSPDTAVIKMTSASTGEPQGVATSSDSLLADDEGLTASMGIRADDRLVATVPWSHSYGLSSLVVPALTRGTLLVVPDEAGPFASLSAVRQAGATVFPTVPAYLTQLSRLEDAPQDLGSLRLVISAGARLPVETAERFRSRFDQSIHVFYGASECGGVTYDRGGDAGLLGTVGQPVDGVQVEIETDSGSDPETPGRVTVRSAAVAGSYYPTPDSRLGDGRFVSEDLGQLVDGELTLVGRLNDLINVKGIKVNPIEVERVIAQQGSVVDVQVVGVQRAGSQEQLVRAIVACNPGSLTEEQLIGWCRNRLSEFKVPRSVVLVENIPRTERGKVDRTALARLAGAAPDRNRTHG